MGEEKELKRHEKVLEQIKNAKTKEEIPNRTLSVVTKYLADNVYFDDRHISVIEFKPVLDAVLQNGDFNTPEVKQAFMEVLKNNYSEITEEEYNAQYEKVVNDGKIGNLINEAQARDAKLIELQKQDNLKQHNETMKQIKTTFEIKYLPKVGKGLLNRKVQRATQNDYIDKFPIEKVNDISDDLLNGKKQEDILEDMYQYCQQKAGEEKAKKAFEQIKEAFLFDETIGYTAEEIKAKDKRILYIYKQDHEEIMENIRNAKRISQLPTNLTFSTLANYLSGNTTIYPKAERITTTDFKDITELLLANKKFSSPDVKKEIIKMAEKYYPEKSREAAKLLYKKLSSLPRTKYFVEEINYSQERQEEFIGRSCSNVNVYFVPNPNSPIEGGRFYNCYINRVDNLNLEQILPLDLEKIVPPEMDVDSIEWYVQEKYDETFKAAGGIILNKDETIGNVNVFKPSDGKIGITPEEQSKYKELEELGSQVKQLIEQKKANSERFKAAQEAFLKYEQESDEKLAELEERISGMLSKEKDENEGR